jgi:hypothetical protein
MIVEEVGETQTNQPLVNDISGDVESDDFSRTGFAKLSGLFTNQIIENLRTLTSDQLKGPEESDGFGKTFGKYAYDIGNESGYLKDILQSKSFQKVISKFIQKGLIFTQGVGFELRSEKSLGFDWHIGVVSFNYIRPEDKAWSMWIPLDEIDVDQQDGGLRCVSEQILSGRDAFKKNRAQNKIMVDIIEKNIFGWPEEKINEYKQKARAQGVSSMLQGENLKLANENSVDYSFKLGDALLFNKNVFHRSVPLKAGPLKFRRAYVMRFLNLDAKYDRQELEASLSALRIISDKPPTSYGLLLSDLKDNEAIRSSRTLKQWKIVEW